MFLPIACLYISDFLKGFIYFHLEGLLSSYIFIILIFFLRLNISTFEYSGVCYCSEPRLRHFSLNVIMFLCWHLDTYFCVDDRPRDRCLGLSFLVVFVPWFTSSLYFLIMLAFHYLLYWCACLVCWQLCLAGFEGCGARRSGGVRSEGNSL